MNASRKRSTLAGLVAALVLGTATYGQDAPAELFDDFIHYTLIAKPDLAAAKAELLLQSGRTNAELAQLLDDDTNLVERFNRAIVRGLSVLELEDIATELDRRVEQGRLDLARDANRIDGAIEMLLGKQREKMHGRQRLIAAGEYAIPKLLKVVTDGQNDRLKVAVSDVFVKIGRQAVSPLCQSLAYIDPASQRYVCDRLAELGYPHAAAYLLELSTDDSTVTATRDAAARAFRRIGGGSNDLSVLYTELGQQYFREYESLIAFPGEATNNIWNYDVHSGLLPTPVPTEIFSEVMAMSVASKALSIDPSNDAALSLYVASNLRRENQLPQGEADPVYGENDYSPLFYATVYGTGTCLDVLAMALDTTDTPLVRDAIAALAKTTGGSNLFSSNSGQQPLLDALKYPDRRVQYEAALTLGRALPQRSFPGDSTVVPTLASAVRSGGASYAAVISDDEEQRRTNASKLEGQGYTVIAVGDSLRNIANELNQSVGVDLVVVDVNSIDLTTKTLADLRTFPRTNACPVMLICVAVDRPALTSEFSDELSIEISTRRTNDEAFAAGVEQLMRRASGGQMSDAESEGYAIEALSALRDVAIAGNTSYNIADAETSLLEALDGRSGGTRLLVADTLALMDSDRSQRKLFDAALAATDFEQIELLNRVTSSVKRYGDHAEERHVNALLKLVSESRGATAEAAAQLHGALNLSTQDAVGLIPQEGK